MRLISLNTWCGRSLYPLMQFLKERRDSTDIFCFQEVTNHRVQERADKRHPEEYVCGPLFQKIYKALRGFSGHFAFFEDDIERMSLATFWRNDLGCVISIGDFETYRPAKPRETGSTVFSPRKLQHMNFFMGGTDRMAGGIQVKVINYHGLWNNGPKTDTPERIVQSKLIREFMDKFRGPKILCGDMNLLPNTESMRILGDGMRNLVTEFGIQSTRTPLYRHYDNPAEPKFADYVLVSSEIKVNEFKVLPDLVSDHSPLYLDFDLKTA